MQTIKGPALLIAQLADDRPPFNSLPLIAEWAAGGGLRRMIYLAFGWNCWRRRLLRIGRRVIFLFVSWGMRGR